MEIDTSLLAQVLTWFVSGGGAAAAAYFLLEKVEWFKKKTPEGKRYWSLGLASGFAVAAYIAFVFIGYQPMPETVRGWIEALFAIAFTAVTGSQTLHGRFKLRAHRH